MVRKVWGEEREQDKSQDVKGRGCMRGWWYKDD